VSATYTISVHVTPMRQKPHRRIVLRSPHYWVCHHPWPKLMEARLMPNCQHSFRPLLQCLYERLNSFASSNPRSRPKAACRSGAKSCDVHRTKSGLSPLFACRLYKISPSRLSRNAPSVSKTFSGNLHFGLLIERNLCKGVARASTASCSVR
jgi:hypothetical protein